MFYFIIIVCCGVREMPAGEQSFYSLFYSGDGVVSFGNRYMHEIGEQCPRVY